MVTMDTKLWRLILHLLSISISPRDSNSSSIDIKLSQAFAIMDAVRGQSSSVTTIVESFQFHHTEGLKWPWSEVGLIKVKVSLFGVMKTPPSRKRVSDDTKCIIEL